MGHTPSRSSWRELLPWARRCGGGPFDPELIPQRRAAGATYLVQFGREWVRMGWGSMRQAAVRGHRAERRSWSRAIHPVEKGHLVARPARRPGGIAWAYFPQD